jgi:hypothetical protein
MEEIAFKLQMIKALWTKLRKTKRNTSEYEAIMTRIGGLSAEYESLISAKDGPASRHLSRNPITSRHLGHSRSQYLT